MLSFWSSAKAAASSSSVTSPTAGDAAAASPATDKVSEQEPVPRVSADETARTIVPSTTTSMILQVTDVDVASIVTEQSSPAPTPAPARPRRISFRSLAFFYGKVNAKDKDKERPSLSVEEEREIPEEEEGKGKEPAVPPKATPGGIQMSKKSAKRVDRSAVVLRNLILGSADTSAKGKPSHNTLKKVKGQLLQTKDANKVIAKLRTLPNPDGSALTDQEGNGEVAVSRQAGPIHAVCLDVTESEAEDVLFSRLTTNANASQPANIASADMASLISVLNDTRIVTLISSPDFGFGQPPGGDGPLAGAVPSPGAFNQGFKEITVQLLALGFATSKAVYPDHTGVYPPTDRLSVLTYWWGLEVCLPPPSMAYLANVKSIQGTALNFLTAFALFNNGVKEILPFVRYISQFLDFEWGAIKAADKGKGVVCASTWVMPAAMVPRAWDFPDPPPDQGSELKSGKPQSSSTSPTLVFPGSKASPFTPSTPVLPPVLVTPATLPRHAPGLLNLK